MFYILLLIVLFALSCGMFTRRPLLRSVLIRSTAMACRALGVWSPCVRRNLSVDGAGGADGVVFSRKHIQSMGQVLLVEVESRLLILTLFSRQIVANKYHFIC
jgi:hypothetical protein